MSCEIGYNSYVVLCCFSTTDNNRFQTDDSFNKLLSLVYSPLSARPLLVSEAEHIPSLTEKAATPGSISCSPSCSFSAHSSAALASFLFGSIPQWA